MVDPQGVVALVTVRAFGHLGRATVERNVRLGDRGVPANNAGFASYCNRPITNICGIGELFAKPAEWSWSSLWSLQLKTNKSMKLVRKYFSPTTNPIFSPEADIPLRGDAKNRTKRDIANVVSRKAVAKFMIGIILL